MLQGTLQWLMGSPAGLKLNDPLNSLLGTCFLYLVNLWWSFLGKLSLQGQEMLKIFKNQI